MSAMNFQIPSTTSMERPILEMEVYFAAVREANVPSGKTDHRSLVPPSLLALLHELARKLTLVLLLVHRGCLQKIGVQERHPVDLQPQKSSRGGGEAVARQSKSEQSILDQPTRFHRRWTSKSILKIDISYYN